MEVPPPQSSAWASVPVEDLAKHVAWALCDYSPAQLRPIKPYLLQALAEVSSISMASQLVEALAQIDPGATGEILQCFRHKRPFATGDAHDWDRIGETLNGLGDTDRLIEGLLDPEENIRNLASLPFALRSDRPALDVLLKPLVRLAPRSSPGVIPRSALDPWDLAAFWTPHGDKPDPLRDGPPHDSYRKGLIYSDSAAHLRGAEGEWFSMCRWLLADAADLRHYAAFAEEARNATTQGYLIQVRVILFEALVREFPASRISSQECEQDRSVLQLLEAFVRHQQAYWGNQRMLDRDAGAESEAVGFGFLVEGPGIYRLWSRPVAVST